ncbi:Class I mannose-6-phosphate isomerase [Planctomycetales bacterium 10988]|nr:Class I mannose-6-phosphate isomerase [Planctomycetales bacterium 10988]
MGDLLGKPIGEGEHYAESWEICDHDEDQSKVAFGSLAGSTLGSLVKSQGEQLFGRHAPQKRFPLLLKFLDAQRNLSVQVHPNDAQAAQLDPPDLGKTEAWVVMRAEPGAKIYAGLEAGVDQSGLAQAVEEGKSEECLASFEPKEGDCAFLTAGTVHAIGEGLVIAEIQQASDVTYRLYDWNRVGTDGKPRPLHIEQGLKVIDYERGPVTAQTPKPLEGSPAERLVECDKFILNRWKIDEPVSIGGSDCFHIVSVLAGSVEVEGDPSGESLELANSMLIPACCGEVKITPKEPSILMHVHLPIDP